MQGSEQACQQVAAQCTWWTSGSRDRDSRQEATDPCCWWCCLHTCPQHQVQWALWKGKDPHQTLVHTWSLCTCTHRHTHTDTPRGFTKKPFITSIIQVSFEKRKILSAIRNEAWVRNGALTRTSISTGVQKCWSDEGPAHRRGSCGFSLTPASKERKQVSYWISSVGAEEKSRNKP